MVTDYISFGIPDDRCKYAKEVGALFRNNNLNEWAVFPSVDTAEIFIRPRNPPEENLRVVSRVSLQVNNNAISFGISGYFPKQAKDIINMLTTKEEGYKYHDKGYDKDGKKIPGRWWLTKSFDNLENIIKEFRDKEPILLKNIPKSGYSQ